MASNFLEQLAKEWYEYRRNTMMNNVKFGRLVHSSWTGEIDLLGPVWSINASTLYSAGICVGAGSWAADATARSDKVAVGPRSLTTRV